MPLVKAQCTNCGATLDVDNTKDAAICPFCNTPYIVEKAINNYNITISSANIKIDTNDKEDLLKAGDTYLYKLGDYSNAALKYREVTLKYPDDWRGWWGIAIAFSENFTNFRNPACFGNFENALKLMTDDKEAYEKKYKEFVRKYNLTNEYDKRNQAKMY